MDMVRATAEPAALIRRVSALIQAGQTGAARPLLAAARQMTGPSASLSHLTALLALRDGSIEDAQDALDDAIDAAPDHPGLRKCRAELRQRMGDVEGATRDAAEAVILDRHDPVAQALLGALMLELGRPADAVACLGDAVARNPADAAFREALAAAHNALGDPDSALTTLMDGIAAAPAVPSLRNAAVLQCIRCRDFSGAVRVAEQARAVGIADACLFGLMGHALSSLGRHDEAAHAYREALKLGPDDPYVRHLVSATGAVPGADRAPEAYVRTVFDGYADRFEAHLISLGYRIPGLVRALLLEHPNLRAGRPLGPLLDLGCGTGLVGLAIGDLPVGPIVGVDASARMLDQARTKAVYANLIHGDLIAMLRDGGALRTEVSTSDATAPTHWPAIVAADVLCYFGALDEIFAAAHAKLEPRGWFILSLEELMPDRDGLVPGAGDWALLRQGRYAHARAYAQRAALDAGFAIRRMLFEPVRFEADMPVDGIVMVLERRRHDS